MNLTDYFNSINIKSESQGVLEYEDTLASQISTLSDVEDMAAFDLAIIGIEDATNSPRNKGCANSPNLVRESLYSLVSTSRDLNIVDLGNIKGSTLNDRYLALQEVFEYLLGNNVVVLFLGGSQDYFIPFVKSLANKSKVTLSVIDNRVDFSFDENRFDSDSSISQLTNLVRSDSLKVNVVGAQKYFVSSAQEDFFTLSKWSVYRLKDVCLDKISNVEPILRDSQVICLDAAAIQNNVMPSLGSNSVNGVSGLDSCKMMWYAGLSSRVKVCGLSEYNSEIDTHLKGAMLFGQMAWHFIEGISHNLWEMPTEKSNNYKIYVLRLQEFAQDVRFYKSRLSDRWWCEFGNGQEFSLIACSESDYQESKVGKLPKCLYSYC